METNTVSTSLKKGDPVIVIAGGHKNKRPNKGKVGKILRFVGAGRSRALVEGVNMVTRHKRRTNPNDRAEKVSVESSIHVSNLMYYAEKIKAGVRIKRQLLADGKKVRGYLDPSSGEFVQIDAK